MTVGRDGSDLVIRFSPFLPDRLLENAEDTHYLDSKNGRTPRYGVSVLAGSWEPDETLEEAVQRICATSSMWRGKKVAVATVDMLRNAEFQVVSDATAEELLHHLVGDDPMTTKPDTVRMAAVFSCKVNNPNWRSS